MAGEGEEGKGFKVEDRRRFSQGTGEPRKDMNDEAAQAAQEGPGKTNQTGDPNPPEGSAISDINFSTFIISLSTQVLMHLGEIPNPLDGKVEKDAAGAKQMIDIISILREKTRGNLDPGEQKLMEDVLYDLRMRYVEVVKKG